MHCKAQLCKALNDTPPMISSCRYHEMLGWKKKDGEIDGFLLVGLRLIKCMYTINLLALISSKDLHWRQERHERYNVACENSKRNEQG